MEKKEDSNIYLNFMPVWKESDLKVIQSAFEEFVQEFNTSEIP